MVKWEELLTPRGRLHAAALWPSVEGSLGYDQDFVRVKLQEYIKAGASEAASLAEESRDAAIAWYCYWRAFDEKYQEQVVTASSATLADGASASRSVEQMRELKALRDEAWEQFMSLVVVTAEDPPEQRSSASVPTEYSW